MAGEAKTDQFILSTATVMLGPQADLMKLDKSNSIGLVKNFTISANASYTELTQGAKNTLVASVQTGNDVQCSMETYEYTAANIAYGLGLDGSVHEAAGVTPTTVSGAVAEDATAVTVADGTSIAAGDWIKFGEGDDLVIGLVDSITTNNITLAQGASAAIADGASATVMKAVGVGSRDEQPYLSARIAGKLQNGEDITILIPKLRITQGFSVTFTTDNFGNMPFQFGIVDQVNADPFFATFRDHAGGGQAAILKAT